MNEEKWIEYCRTLPLLAKLPTFEEFKEGKLEKIKTD